MKKEDEIVINRDIYDIITDLKDALRTQDAIMKMLTEQSKPQPGDYVNAVIEVWAQNNDFGKRINANLVGIQYVKQGESFGKASDDDLFEITEKSKDEPKTNKENENNFKPLPTLHRKPNISNIRSSSLSDQSLKSIQDDIDDIFGE